MRWILILLLAAAPALAQTGQAQRHMIAAAHPLAAEAGREVLRQGGGALDAAIAAQLVLTLVEPQAGGIGGSTFILHYDKAAARVRSYDGRETAPLAARPDRFLDAGGQPRPYPEVAYALLAVGVPGMVRAFALAHARHGRMPWADLFAAAIRHAEQGFATSPRMALVIARTRDLGLQEAAANLYWPGGAPLPAGATHANPALARTLRALAAQGADALHGGEIAAAILAALPGGDLTAQDLAAYRAVERDPVCGPYRRWRVCSMGPPSSGAIALLQILGMLERFDLAAMGRDSADAWHVYAEASALAYADRGRHVGDGPWPAGLLDRTYLAARGATIDPQRAVIPKAPGEPPATRGTSHISVVDQWGDAVSMTSSVGDAFGARRVAAGFVLNNELADFDFAPGGPNEPGPGKRPRSSMTPTLVFDADGQLVLAVGSQGGAQIIGFVAKMLIGTLDWNLDMQAAIDLGHVQNRNGPTFIEEGPSRPALAEELRRRGHDARVMPFDSGQQGIRIVGGGALDGGGDRRREGVALGD